MAGSGGGSGSETSKNLRIIRIRNTIALWKETVYRGVADPRFLSRIRFFLSRTRMQGGKDSGSRFRICIREFEYFQPNTLIQSSQKIWFRILDLDLVPSRIRIPDQEDQKNTNTRICNTTLVYQYLDWPAATLGCQHLDTLQQLHVTVPAHQINYWTIGYRTSRDIKPIVQNVRERLETLRGHGMPCGP